GRHTGPRCWRWSERDVTPTYPRFAALRFVRSVLSSRAVKRRSFMRRDTNVISPCIQRCGAFMTVHDFHANSIDGPAVNLSEYRGKVLLIVNVASQCGFTPQYAGLEKLQEKYRDRGFAVLGFPCNQFGKQEPGSESDIKSFCETRFGVTFPMFS